MLYIQIINDQEINIIKNIKYINIQRKKSLQIVFFFSVIIKRIDTKFSNFKVILMCVSIGNMSMQNIKSIDEYKQLKLYWDNLSITDFTRMQTDYLHKLFFVL